MYQGVAFIREIRISDQLASDRLAKLCRVEPSAHSAEVQTAIADIVNACAARNSYFSAGVADAAIPSSCPDPRNIGLVLSVSVDASTRSLVFEFTDASTGAKFDTVALRFSNIRSVMDPYRQIIEKSGFTRFNNLSTCAHGELLRQEIHCRLLHRIGLNVYPATDEGRTLQFEWELGRYLGNLIYALFPKGPADDWTW